MAESNNEQQQRRDARFNYFAASVDAAGFPTGSTFIALLTVIPAFLKQLTSSEQVIGGIQSLYLIGVFLPAIFTANFIQRMPRKRPFVFWVAVVERLAILALAIFTWFFGKANPGLLLVLTFLLLGLNFLLMGVNYPAYSAMIAKVIPTARRGALYGWAGAIGGVLAIGASWVLDLLLGRYGFPRGYALGFGISFVILMLSIIPIAFIREPVEDTAASRQDWRSYWRSLGGVMREDRNFGRFIASQALMAFASMSAAFLTVYAIDRFHIGSGTIAFYTGVLAGTSILASAFWGVMIDRKGNKVVIGWGAAAGALACLVAILATNPLVYALVFVLATFSNYALGIACFNIILEFCEPADAPRYIALSSALPVPFRGIAPMLGAVIAKSLGYPWLFGLTAAMLAAGIGVLLTVHEPRHLKNVAIPVEK